MQRDIVKINEELCDGCGLCIPNCHEGALQIIDGKAMLISDLMCDGLGACIGHCPQGAISIEKREAIPYNETMVIKEMIKKGANTVKAHLLHLKANGEKEFLKEAVNYLLSNNENIDFDADKIIHDVHHTNVNHGCSSGSCPGSAEQAFKIDNNLINQPANNEVGSELTHWPIQLHLINPAGNHFKNSDLLIAADCTAFTYGNFHKRFLKGKTMIIACPKLDQGLEIYHNKILSLIDDAMINTITVLIMEVPCCGGLIEIVKSAQASASRKVPVKKTKLNVRGEIIEEEWL
ncbi:MAG: 4Fe-4S binding protein [Marinilabiliales bacterium]